MPIYEYHCDQCGDFEEMQRISAPPLTKCPRCKKKVRRLMSNTSFQLKGSGWYVTDYARSGGNGGKKKDASAGDSGGGDAKSSESKSESKSESEAKSASKSESKPESKPASGGDKAS